MPRSLLLLPRFLDRTEELAVSVIFVSVGDPSNRKSKPKPSLQDPRMIEPISFPLVLIISRREAHGKPEDIIQMMYCYVVFLNALLIGLMNNYFVE